MNKTEKEIVTILYPHLKNIADSVNQELGEEDWQHKKFMVFSPDRCLEYFRKYNEIIIRLKIIDTKIFGGVSVIQIPEPSKTADFKGKGYIGRDALEKLMQSIDLVNKLVLANYNIEVKWFDVKKMLTLVLAALILGLVVGFFLGNTRRIKYTKTFSLGINGITWEVADEYFDSNKKNERSVETAEQTIRQFDATKKKATIKEISRLIVYGENIEKDHGMLLSGNYYVTKEMKELRNDTLALFERIGLKNSHLYSDIEKEVEIGPQIEYQYQFALKLKYIDQYLGALESLRRQINSI